MEDYKVSIVIPCFAERYLKYVDEAIKSAENQTIPCEVIVGGLLGHVLPYRGDKIARAGCVWNDLIELSTGEYIICLGADDRLLPDYVEKTMALMEESGADIVYTHVFKWGSEEGVEMLCEFDPELLKTQNHIWTTSLYKKEIWEKYHYSEVIPYAEDWDFYLGAVENGYWAKLLPEPLFFYRHGEDTGTTEFHKHMVENFNILISLHPRLYGNA